MQNRDEDSLHGVRPTRPRRLSRSQLESMGRDTIIDLYFESDEYIRHLESSVSNSISNEERMKLKQQIIDLMSRQNMLILKMTLKEQQSRELQCEADTLRKRVIPQNSPQLRASLMDPTIDLLFTKMKKELDQTKKKLVETQEELSAWKFTPESNGGKRLMARCRQLYQENEELGKRVASGKVAKLEGDLALYRSFAQEMKQNQKEQDELLLELDEEVEGMQSTIYFLEQQLREAKKVITSLHEGVDPLETDGANVPNCTEESPPSTSSAILSVKNEDSDKSEPQKEQRQSVESPREASKISIREVPKESDAVAQASPLNEFHEEVRETEAELGRLNERRLSDSQSPRCQEKDQTNPSES